MQIGEIYSHLNEYEWLLVHHPEILEEIKNVINSIDAEVCKTKTSKEKTMVGKMLYSPVDINASMKAQFNKYGWKETRTSYWVTGDYQLIRQTLHLPEGDQKKIIEQAGKRPIRSYNQTDFVKERIAVEVQLAKYSFIPYDLFVKHMAFFVGDIIDLGIEIVPMKSMQEQMSSGPGYYEGAIYDIVRQGRGIPAVPLVIIGVQP